MPTEVKPAISEVQINSQLCLDLPKLYPVFKRILVLLVTVNIDARPIDWNKKENKPKGLCTLPTINRPTVYSSD